MLIHLRRNATWLALVLIGALGCEDGGDVDAGPTDGETPLDARATDGETPLDARANDAGSEPTTTLRGRVWAMGGAEPIVGAEVVSAVASATTGEGGAFEVAVPADGVRAAVTVRAGGFADGVVAVRAVGGAAAWAEISLVRVSVTEAFDAADGARLEAGGGARVRVPPGALVDAAGAAVTGMVTMELAVLNPRTPNGLDAFPGTFESNRDGEDVLLESVSVMDVTATQDGERLQVAPGATLELEWPANGAPESDETIPIWSLDPATGAWRPEGEAVRVSTVAGTVYRASVSHMSWWNLDYATTTITCVRGCVTFESAPVQNAFLRVRALTSGTGGGGFTGEDGCFAEDVRGGLDYAIVAAGIDGVSEATVFTPPATLMRAADDPSACFDIGTLELMPRDPSSTCADGRIDCSGVCVDLRTDPTSCGACGADCRRGAGGEGGGGIVGASCIEGVCACASDRTNCDSACVDLATDRNHCGACGAACPIGQACADGTCEPIVCAASLSLCGNDCVDLDTHTRHCGACDAWCTIGEGDALGQICDAGTCRCPDGAADCIGAGWCTDLTSNVSNCGACGNACTATQQCNAGVCEEIVCAAGETICNRRCVDTRTDPGNCGGCWATCDLEAREVCNSGTCGCASGSSKCGGFFCNDLSTSVDHCGACGNACTATQECDAGMCREIVCAAGETVCSRSCVDTDTDLSNCGACGAYCELSACTGGVCSCAATEAACPGGETFYCVGDGSTDCPAGDVSGPCDDLGGDYSLSGTCPGTSVTVRQRGCGAFVYVAGACSSTAILSGSTADFSCGGTPCTATVSGSSLTVSCGGGACTSTGTRI